MNRVSIVAAFFLSLIAVSACGEADRPLSGAGISTGGGAVGNLVVPALTDEGVTGTDAEDVTDTPAGQNRMHIGRPHGQTR